MAETKKVYFPGLNGIRAIAALVVVVGHIGQFLTLFGRAEVNINDMPGFAVTMFFALSGFLITYLLLREKGECGGVAVRQFYLRRILRIWPLYYLAIALCFLLLAVTHDFPRHSSTSFLLYIFMLPNAAYIAELKLRPITHLWSVGMEEQFYAVWPWLLRRFRNIAAILLTLIAVFVGLKIGAQLLKAPLLAYILTICRFDCMAIGGLGAVWVYGGMKNGRWVFNTWLQVFAWAWLAWSVFVGPVHLSSLFEHEIHAAIYTLLILNVSCNPKPLISLEHPLLDWLGRISYGIYVYHLLVIYALAGLPAAKLLPTWSLYVVVPALTLVVAHLSFTCFEQRFLHLKERFTRVASRSSRW